VLVSSVRAGVQVRARGLLERLETSVKVLKAGAGNKKPSRPSSRRPSYARPTLSSRAGTRTGGTVKVAGQEMDFADPKIVKN